MRRVLAKAILDVTKQPTPTTLGSFSVEVWGEEPHDFVRHYEIQAKTMSENTIKQIIKDLAPQLRYIKQNDKQDNTNSTNSTNSDESDDE